ncbi:MAG: transcriptional regulator PpsR [Phyllobacteriaceae bacterium]|nr:transcriptional regulator PpsR [Phyllobacteriaceae bacterium]
MDTQVTRESHRSFEKAGEIFGRLPPAAVAEIAAAGGSVALALGGDGTILDLAYHSPDLGVFGADRWVGRNIVETVTGDSAPKIVSMLEEVATRGMTRRRQVNHSASGLEDLPVEYVFVRPEGMDGCIALGTELRRQVELQQQLINIQIDLERRNRTVSEQAARYRAQFKMAEAPVLVVNGMDLRIADANQAAAAFVGLAEKKLEGAAFASLLDPVSKAAVTEQMTAARFSGEHATLAATLANGHAVRIAFRPFRETNAVNLVVTISAAEAASTGDDRRADAVVVDMLPEPCVLIDAEGTVLEVNSLFVDLVGLPGKAQFIGRDISDWLGASSVDMNVLISRLEKLGSVRRFSSVVNDARGAQLPVVLSAAYHEAQGKPRIVISLSETSRSDSHFRLQPSGDIAASTDFSELIGRVPLKDLIRDAADIIEKMCIEAALRQTGNNRASAADLLGLSRQSLYMKLRRYGLENFMP